MGLTSWQWVGILFMIGCFIFIVYAIVMLAMEKPLALVFLVLIGAVFGFLAFYAMFAVYTLTPNGSWDHFFIATDKWGPWQLPSFIMWPAMGALFNTLFGFFMLHTMPQTPEEKAAHRKFMEWTREPPDSSD